AAAATPRARAGRHAAAGLRTAGATVPRRTSGCARTRPARETPAPGTAARSTARPSTSDAEQLVGQRHDPRRGAGLAEPLPHEGESLPLRDGDRVTGSEQRPECGGE